MVVAVGTQKMRTLSSAGPCAASGKAPLPTYVLWNVSANLLPKEPRGRAIPYLWRWDTLLPLVRRGGELAPLSRGAERRVLGFINPGLPTRYGALYSFFLEGLEAASARLKAFVAKAGQATLVGEVFDDAATGQGLLNYFLRAWSCGAVTEQEAVDKSGLTLAELRGRSFVKILNTRRGVPA